MVVKDALIKICGFAEGSEPIEVFSEGKAYFTGGGIILEYQENELSGMEGTVSKIVISDDLVTLNRIGKYSSTLVFSQYNETSGQLPTPMGQVSVSVFTEKLDLSIAEEEISINLVFSFSLGGGRIKNSLTLNCQFINH